jgi:hypothetical protein
MNWLYRCFLYCFLRTAPLPAFDLSKTVKHDVQDLLSESLGDPGCGVFVHWGIKGSGKTAYAACLAQKLKDSGRSVIFLDCSSLAGGMAIRKFCDVLPERKTSFSLDPTKPPPTTIIVDDFDECSDTNHHLRSIIRTIAKASITRKRFNVLLLVTSASRAKEILDWDWAHIRLVGTPGCGVWTTEHVSELLSMHPRWNGDPETLALCCRAGTPGFVVWSAGAAVARMRLIADKNAAEWEAGVRELNSL